MSARIAKERPCCVVGCNNRVARRYVIAAEKHCRQIWLQRIGNAKLFTLDANQMRNIRICQTHFHEDCIDLRGKLKKGYLPTINLPGYKERDGTIFFKDSPKQSQKHVLLRDIEELGPSTAFAQCPELDVIPPKRTYSSSKKRKLSRGFAVTDTPMEPQLSIDANSPVKQEFYMLTDTLIKEEFSIDTDTPMEPEFSFVVHPIEAKQDTDLMLEGAVETTKKSEKRIDTSSRENDELKNQLMEQKKKVDVFRARCKVLETEQTINKSKIASLTAQEERDQNLLKTLTNQVGNQQDFTNETIKQRDRCIKSLQQENESLKIELSKQKLAVENLTKSLNDKMEETRDMVRIKRQSPRPLSAYGQKNKNLIDERFVNRLEVEKTRLLELTELQASRIIAERDAHAKTQNILRMERQKAAKLETSVARLELEVTSVRSGSYCGLSNSRSSDVKNNDLKSELELAQETIKALKTRLEIEQRERKVDLKEFFKIVQASKDE